MATTYGVGVAAREGEGRFFKAAVALSLAAHAFALFVLPGLLERVPEKSAPPAAIVARLMPPQRAPDIPPERAPAPPPEPVRPQPRPDVTPPNARPVLTAPATAVAPAQVQSPVEAPRAPEPAQPVAPAPIARVEPAPAAPAAAPTSGDAADPATVGQYRIAVISAARRFKRYPRIAMDNNWEGKAEVRLVIGPDGGIVSISLKSKSGFEVLDQQALEMIRRAKPQAPIPPALRGKGFTIDVPVVFSLKEEG